MEHFFLNLFATNPEAWKHWGYAIIFATALVESILFLGIFIPGQIIIILAGFLITLGMFDFQIALIAAAVGAVIGDALGFIIGKKYKDKIPGWLGSFIKREDLEKTQRLIELHSIKTIFIGRLHSMTRTFAPFVAGTTSITLRRFIACDFLAAITWAFLSLLIGYIFGQSFELAAKAIGKFILIATIITVVLAYIAKLLYDNRHKVSFVDFAILAICSASAYVFAVTAQEIGTGRLLTILDVRTVEIIDSIRTPMLTTVMTITTAIGDPLPVTIASAILVVYLLLRKRYYLAFIGSLAISSGAVLLHILKVYFEKARPELGLITASGGSFPSGHTMSSIIFACVISYTFIRHLNNGSVRNVLYCTVFTLAVCIGFSRVYLNVHWASDVLGGLSAGIFWATFIMALTRLAIWFINRTKRRHELPNLQ